MEHVYSCRFGTFLKDTEVWNIYIYIFDYMSPEYIYVLNKIL